MENVETSLPTILDVCRRVMLMDPVAQDLNLLPMTDPTERVKKVALVVIEAAQRHTYIRDMVEKGGLMRSLHALAKGRAAGEVEPLHTLLADLPRAATREGK